MKKLLSLTTAAADRFASLTGREPPEWFCTTDPAEGHLGSGGGTVHLLREAWREENAGHRFEDWLEANRGILLHAGGESRRLPAYAAEGKALIPVPVFRWSTGQRLDQVLLDLQVPFLERVMEATPASARWLVASGDVLVHAESLPQELPEADVVCLGLWGDADQAGRHGVFFLPRDNSSDFSFMLQKPRVEEIRKYSGDHYFLLDVGIWLLSGRAMRTLVACCGGGENKRIHPYDLYGTFGPALGDRPAVPDERLAGLSAAVVPLEEGEFYHFGSGADLIASNLRLQNRIIDQRRLGPGVKLHPSQFVQNSLTAPGLLGSAKGDIWIEGSHVPAGWRLARQHILTGIPENDWRLRMPPGHCVDFVPLSGGRLALRVYGFHDTFRGECGDGATQYCGEPLVNWLEQRGLDLERMGLASGCDIQAAPLFPVHEAGQGPEGGFLQWLLDGSGDYAAEFVDRERISAREISLCADPEAIAARRGKLLRSALGVMAGKGARSIFHQLDLEHLAGLVGDEFSPPVERPDPERELFHYIRDAMFRSALLRKRGGDWEAEDAKASAALREVVIKTAAPCRPVLDCLEDQIIWGRSPVRLDLAGGWTDTPPYCFLNGGRVVNVAVELNGQPPIQAFVRRRPEGGIKLRSIDLGVSQEIHTFDQLRTYADIGSGFAIPKAALALCGFLPEFHKGRCPESLDALLRQFGGGIEISLLCAVPKGSGLGTSSILAATVLGVLNEFCQLGWDPYAIAQRVLVLEQMLTSGGGWQDQYGGICRGLKHLETGPGLLQSPKIRYIDDHLFTDPSLRPNCLLYYTGITRVAHSVLGEIVRGMFLNSRKRLELLEKIGRNADRLHGILQEEDYEGLAACVRRSWELNKALDPGTSTSEIEAMLRPLEPWIAGCKLLGAGGGGYLLMLAKDGTAAQRIKEHLSANPPNARARFVEMTVSRSGLQVTRS